MTRKQYHSRALLQRQQTLKRDIEKAINTALLALGSKQSTVTFDEPLAGDRHPIRAIRGKQFVIDDDTESGMAITRDAFSTDTLLEALGELEQIPRQRKGGQHQ
jgi:hypothetical protein